MKAHFLSVMNYIAAAVGSKGVHLKYELKPVVVDNKETYTVVVKGTDESLLSDEFIMKVYRTEYSLQDLKYTVDYIVDKQKEN